MHTCARVRACVRACVRVCEYCNISYTIESKSCFSIRVEVTACIYCHIDCLDTNHYCIFTVDNCYHPCGLLSNVSMFTSVTFSDCRNSSCPSGDVVTAMHRFTSSSPLKILVSSVPSRRGWMSSFSVCSGLSPALTLDVSSLRLLHRSYNILDGTCNTCVPKTHLKCLSVKVENLKNSGKENTRACRR